MSNAVIIRKHKVPPLSEFVDKEQVFRPDLPRWLITNILRWRWANKLPLVLTAAVRR
jgi:hypothetical protein